MGHFAYKNDLLKPWRKTLSEQLVHDLNFVADGPLLTLAKRTRGGWSHRGPFLKNAKRLFQARLNEIPQDLAIIADALPWMTDVLKIETTAFVNQLDDLTTILGGPRTALVCIVRAARADTKETALAPELFTKCASTGKPQAAKPEARALRNWLLKNGLVDAEPIEEKTASTVPDQSVRKLKDEIDRIEAARENELRAERRHHANALADLTTKLSQYEAAALASRDAQTLQTATSEAAQQSLLTRVTKAEAEATRLKGELDQAREHVAKKAREIAEELLSEELRPWFVDARKLREASEEVTRLRHLTAETVEAARKAQRDADPFLAKEHELRQALPQMDDMLKLLRRYQRTAGSVLPAIVELEKRITVHIEKTRFDLDRRDQPSDPFLERIAAKINVAEEAELTAIEGALVSAEQSGLVDSRHADLYRGDIHRRRSLLADQRFHEQKSSGPVALLERAIAIGEAARLGLDANNFACLQQSFLGLKLVGKRNPQGELRYQLDQPARQKVLTLLEQLATEGTGLLLWASFDGQASQLQINNQRLKTTFSRAGAKADHDLMDLVGKDKSSEGPWFIVSDDAEVRDACARQGAYIISNESFVRLLAGRNLRPLK